jgi:hypothetical protein
MSVNLDKSCSCHPNEILKIRSLELNATSGKQGFRTKDMHVIPAEILNGHNKILIDNIASELIVIENARPPLHIGLKQVYMYL